MSIAVNGGASAQNSGTITIVHAAAAAATSQLSSASSASCVAGREITFAVQLRDAFGNDCTSTTASTGLSVSLDNAGSQVWSYALVGLGAGLFQGTFKPQTSGSYDLQVKFSSTLVQSGSMTVTVTGSSTDHSKCVVDTAGSGLAQNVTAGATVSFEVSTFDSFSNAVDNGAGDVFTFSLDGSDTRVLGTVAALGNGKHRVSYVGQKAGMYVASLFLGSDEIALSATTAPRTVEVLPSSSFDVAHSSISGSGSSLAVAGLGATFVLTLGDVYGNAYTTATMPEVNPSSLSLSVTSGPGAFVGSSTTKTNNGDGTITFGYALSAAGVYQLTTAVAGVSFGPISVVVSPASSTGAQSRLSNVTAALTPSEAGSSILHIFDEFGNSIGELRAGDALSASLECPNGDCKTCSAKSSLPAVITYVGAGSYRVSYSASIAGTYKLAAQVNGVSLSSKPNVVVRAGQPDATRSIVSAIPAQSVAGETLGFSVQLLDAYANVVGSPSHTVRWQLVGKSAGDQDTVPTSLFGQAAATSGQSGNYSVLVTPVQAGTYEIKLFLGQEAMCLGRCSTHCAPSSTAVFSHELVVKPAVVSGAKSSFSFGRRSVETLVAGNAVSQQIVLRDTYSNLLAQGAFEYDAQVSPAIGSVSVQPYSNGTASFTFSFTSLGAALSTLQCTLEIRVRPSGGSAAWDKIAQTVVLPLAPAAADASRTTFTPAQTSTVAGVSAFGYVNVFDRFGNSIESGAAALFSAEVAAATTTTTTTTAAVKAEYVSGNRYKLTWARTLAGPYGMDVKVSEAPISGSPFALSIASAQVEALACRLFSDVLESRYVIAGVQRRVLFIAKDRFGNNITTASLPAAATLTLSSLRGNVAPIVGTFAHAGSELHEARFTITEAGFYGLSAALGGRPLDSTRPSTAIRAYDAPTSASKSLIKTSSLVSGVAGAALAFLIEARDAFDNVRTYAKQHTSKDVFSVEIKSAGTSTVVVSPSATYVGNGEYSVSFVLPSTGSYDVEVKLGATLIKNSPVQNFVVTPADVDASQSTYAPTSGITFVAGTSTSLSITSKDTNGNVRTAGGDTFAVRVAGEFVVVERKESYSFSILPSPSLSSLVLRSDMNLV